MKYKTFVWSIIIFTLFIFLIMCIMLRDHEKTHEKILLDDGCFDVEVRINYLSLEGFAYCIDSYYKESVYAKTLHELNESFFKHSAIMILVIYLLFLVLLINSRRD